eukprot:m.284010 g.284010  ORF g.284010 m.284010 type:complete len:199 (+) comp169335_c0_seq1:150-746(+)
MPEPANDAYPHEIYNVLMAVCFVDATLRPSFRTLYDSAVQLGASEDDQAVEELATVQRYASLATVDVRETLSGFDLLERQGPSVHHLSTKFIQATLRAVEKNLANISGLDRATDAKIYHMVNAYGKPAGAKTKCPRDGKVGAAYVDTLRGDDNVGVATALLSYSWGYKVQDVVDALVEWTSKEERDPKTTYIWYPPCP